MKGFEPCAEAPIGVVTNCVSIECASRGCAVAAAKVAGVVSLDDLVDPDMPDRRRWSCDRCDWYTTEFLPVEGQTKRSTVAHVYELCRHYAAVHPSPERCPSCEHRAEFHQPEGCWYSVTQAKPGTTIGCNCIGWNS